MERMPKNARVLETLGESIYRDKNGMIRIKAPILMENNMPIYNSLQNITDDYGNKRFLEGTITPETIEGITWSYAKWSLSGTHLMIVVCGAIEATKKFNGGDTLFKVYLPSWIRSKIATLVNKLIAYSTFIAVDTNYGSEVVSVYYDKETDHILCGLSADSETFTNNANFRIQFDLLIDSD